MGGGGGGGEGEPEFQIAPMIDVLLTLLIFFMSITTAQVEAIDKDIKLPIAPDANERKKDPNQMIVNVKWSTKDQKAAFILDGTTYSDGESLTAALEAKKVGRPSPSILIRGDKELQAKEIASVMNSAGQAGIDTIAFSTFNQ
jgi:biopolymer transport protein ExbD